jgi:hypothetical protein
MSDRDPRCVLTTSDRKAAEALAALLTEKGFPAEPVIPQMGTTASALTGETDAAVAPEFEVWVTNPDHSEPARALIAEQREMLAAVREREAKRAARIGTVTAVCEECGKSSEWPASEMGRTQECPHCGRYVDVPDPDENWDDVDFGSEEEAEAEPESGEDGEAERG